jgi:pilus assembly protein Flp/PilA
MLSRIRNDLLDDTGGATVVEYGLIVSLVVFAVIASVGSVADRTIIMWNDVSRRVTAALGG